MVSKYHTAPNGTRAVREKAESRAGAGKAQDELKNFFCARKKNGQRRMRICQKDIEINSKGLPLAKSGDLICVSTEMTMVVDITFCKI